jgi:hypothetical protein
MYGQSMGENSLEEKKGTSSHACWVDNKRIFSKITSKNRNAGLFPSTALLVLRIRRKKLRLP